MTMFDDKNDGVEKDFSRDEILYKKIHKIDLGVAACERELRYQSIQIILIGVMIGLLGYGIAKGNGELGLKSVR